MSQSQTETDLQHQQLQPCKNYLRKFPDFKTSVTEHRWVHKQKETRTLLLNRNSELFVVLLKKPRNQLALTRMLFFAKAYSMRLKCALLQTKTSLAFASSFLRAPALVIATSRT
jgi:hypothetical protein